MIIRNSLYSNTLPQNRRVLKLMYIRWDEEDDAINDPDELDIGIDGDDEDGADEKDAED